MKKTKAKKNPNKASSPKKATSTQLINKKKVAEPNFEKKQKRTKKTKNKAEDLEKKNVKPNSKRKTVGKNQRKADKRRRAIASSSDRIPKSKNNLKKKATRRNFLTKRIVITVALSLLTSALIMALVIFFTRFQFFKATDQLMAPTIGQEQLVLIDKQKPINRFDVVIFEPTVGENQEYLRRVIGMPGDSIWIAGDTIFINGGLHESISLSPQLHASQLPTGTILFSVDNFEVMNQFQGLTNIPGNNYLVATENFQGQSDSRTFGFINTTTIKGVLSHCF